MGLPWWLNGKEFACSAGDTGHVGSIPGLGRSSRKRLDNPLQYFFMENSMDRGVWQAAVHRVANSLTRLKQLSMHTCSN